MPEPRELQQVSSTTDVSLVTTAETEVAEIRIPLHRRAPRVLLIGHALLTTGVGTTAVTARIRRGTDTTGTLLGEATAEQVKAAAGSTEPFTKVVVDEPAVETNEASYVLTLAQTGATGNGTATEATLVGIEF